MIMRATLAKGRDRTKFRTHAGLIHISVHSIYRDVGEGIVAATRQTNYAVRNIAGTSANSCWCGNWIAHWRLATGSKRLTCSVVGCLTQAQVGAHVQIDDGRFYRHWYIVPMCRAHNIHHNYATMFIHRSVTLIPANVRDSCARSAWWI
jgi:hypothetical protein